VIYFATVDGADAAAEVALLGLLEAEGLVVLGAA